MCFFKTFELRKHPHPRKPAKRKYFIFKRLKKGFLRLAQLAKTEAEATNTKANKAKELLGVDFSLKSFNAKIINKAIKKCSKAKSEFETKEKVPQTKKQVIKKSECFSFFIFSKNIRF